jgi:hypothetical protein
MPDSLTPGQRSQRARIAALERHAQRDSIETTAAARAAGPGSDDYWLRQIEASLPADERLRRARLKKRAHFARLALLSAKTRRARRKAS